MATRVVDSSNSDSGVELPPIPINEVPIGGRRTGTVTTPDQIKGMQPPPYNKGTVNLSDLPLPGAPARAAAPTEVIDYSKLGMVKETVVERPAAKPAEQDKRTKVFFGPSAQSAEGQPSPAVGTAGVATSATEPCVGWVVVISGPMKGRSFELQAGQNHIGRDGSNSIVLAQDPGISRRSHVIITYYHRHNMFNVCRGTEGRGTADLNNQPLEMPTQLNAGDEILLTDLTTLRFVPLCGDNFKWNF